MNVTKTAIIPGNPVTASGDDTILNRLSLVPLLAVAPPLGGLWQRTGNYMSTFPGRLVHMLLALAILAVAVGFVQAFVISHLHSAVEIIGFSTRPSIVAAEQASSTLAFMDADVINDALLGHLSGSGIGKGFQEGLAKMSKLIIAASRNITYESTEVPAIDSLQKNLLWYYGTLGEVRATTASSPSVALERLKFASHINQGFAASSAEALRVANSEPMEEAYGKYDKFYLLLGAVGIGSGAVLILALLKFQVVLAQRTKRVLNGPIFLATVVAVLSQVFFIYAVVAEHSAIRTAKLDAFDSVASLYHAKVAALRANASESMWVLDKQSRPQTEKTFQTMAASVLTSSTGDGPKTKAVLIAMDKALSLESEGYTKQALDTMPHLGGFLGDAVGNVTFGMNERKPLTAAVVAFMRYMRIDGLIRRLEVGGYHAEAVRLDLGVKPGEADWSAGWNDAAFDAAIKSHDMDAINRVLLITGDSDWAFSQFETAIDKAIEVNEDVFDKQIGKAMRLLAFMLPVGIISLLGTVLLAAAGLWQRYREYA